MAWVIEGARFIAFLGGLVFFHELGHFIAAKLCRVKVLKFSLGFGPRVWGFTRGETEYQLAALPLGGFVKMLGEDREQNLSPQERKRSFAEQSPLRRGFISFAGPAVNLLVIPPLVYFGLNLVPQPQMPAVVGIVVPHEPAERAGIESGDRVLSVDGVPTRSFDEMKEAVEERGGRQIDIVVDRRGERKTLRITPSSETIRSPIETTHKGRIGIYQGKPASYIGVVPGSRGWTAGLRTFDRVLTVNGSPVSTVADLTDVLKKQGDHAALKLDVARSSVVDLKTSSVSATQVVSVVVPAGTQPLGIESPDLYVRVVEPGSRAAATGLQPLDRIVAVGGTPVYSANRWRSVVDAWHETAVKDGQTTLPMQVDRGGQRVDVTIEREEKTRKDALVGPIPETDYGFDFHIGASEPFTPAEMVMISYPPLQAAERAVRQTVDMASTIMLSIRALFTGQVSVRGLGGPIQIFQLSNAVADKGLGVFLQLFAAISINLGLVNLLPVPVFDGGNILLAAIEGISRRAIPAKVRDIVQQVGLAMVVALLVLVMTNDIRRVLGL
jgi:regulator of sigma E protease